MVRRFGGIASFIALLGIPVSHAADPIQIAFIDPLSGPFANVGEVTLRHFYLAVEGLNARGGVLGGRKFELVPLDSKGSAQEAQLVLQQVADRGIRFVTQGLGANVAHALLDGIERHNSRNPDRTILYLNYAAILPAFTNEKCSFWHFRFDADVDMKMSAFTDAIAENKRLSKVYLINQDYEFGHAVARAARQFLNQKRPDIQIVGDDLHPLGKLKDFAPYVAKIKASGAQAVITGNWGNDLVLLIRAAGDAGLELEYFTYYGGALGAPMAIGDVGVGRLKQVSQWISNIDSPRAGERTMAYRKRFKDARDDYYATTHWMVIEMLAKAMQTAGSDDPPAIAKVLEGMRWEGDSGEVIMRADNHQLLQPLVVSTFSKVDGKSVRYDVERTGNGFQVDYRVAAKDTALPTTCKMARP